MSSLAVPGKTVFVLRQAPVLPPCWPWSPTPLQLSAPRKTWTSRGPSKTSPCSSMPRQDRRRSPAQGPPISTGKQAVAAKLTGGAFFCFVLFFPEDGAMLLVSIYWTCLWQNTYFRYFACGKIPSQVWNLTFIEEILLFFHVIFSILGNLGCNYSHIW